MKKITHSTVFGILTSLTLTLLLAVGCTNSPKRETANEDRIKPKHYIITLHGIRGNDKSFGDFHSLIKSHLEKINPTYEVIPLNITFAISQRDYTPAKAGREVQAKLMKMVPVLNGNDQISVVGYSMGGQVGLAWYFEALKNPETKKYADQMTHFVGLGSAYWGAKEAGLVTSDIKVLKNTLKFITVQIRDGLRSTSKKWLGETLTNGLIWIQGKTDTQIDAVLAKITTMDGLHKFYDDHVLTIPAVKVSFNELIALSLAGDEATNLRLGLLNNPTQNKKWTSIVPLVQCFESDSGAKIEGCDDFQNPVFKFINNSVNKPYAFGYERRETDSAVITPSGNTQFIQVTETDPNYEDGHTTDIKTSKYALNPATHTTYLTEALHATVVGADQYAAAVQKLSKLGKGWENLAQDVVLVYNINCKTTDGKDDYEKCSNHKSYKYVLKALADCDVENSTCSADGKKNVLDVVANMNQINAGQKLIASQLHGFTLDFNLRLPRGTDLSKFDEKNISNHIQFETQIVDGKKYLTSSLNASSLITVAREKEFASVLLKKTHYNDQEQLKVVMTGLFIPKNDQNYDYKSLENGTAISFKVNLPGMKSRVINAIVRPYHSTYVDLQMSAQ
jgi:hypothetical protein